MRTITLQDKSSSPNTELRLVVDEDENGIERWREYRAPKLPPRRTQGALTVSEQDPLIDFTWAQDDWSAGALRPYYREGDRRYALSKGIDARWEGVLSLGMRQEPPLDYLIEGMTCAKAGDEDSWTKGGDTVATINRDTGVYSTDIPDNNASYKYIGQAVSGQDSWYKQDLANPTVYRGLAIKVGVWIKTTTLNEGTTGVAPNLYIDDSHSSPTGGTAITASDTDWTHVTATKTIHASATSVTIMIGDDDAADGNGAFTFYFDNFTIQVGAAATDSSATEPSAGMATHDNIVYSAQGQVVARWNEDNDVWEAAYIHPTKNATDIVHYNSKIYVAFGDYDTAYVYGSTTSWTTASQTTAAHAYAKFFAVARNNAGNLALWKSETVNTIKSATDPTADGGWSAAYTIGSADRTITKLHSTFDTILIGREDGLWKYNRQFEGTATAENAFAPVSTEWDKGVNTRNFAVGAEWHGFFYTTASSQSFIRWAPGQVQDLTSLFVAPRITGYGGEIRAVATSPHELWVAADIPETAEAGVFQSFPLPIGGTSDKKIKIISLRQDREGNFNVHTIDEATYGDIDNMIVWNDPVTESRFLISAGTVTDDAAGGDVARFYRWALPTRSPAPFIDQQAALAKTGEFDTSVWHGGVPGTSKAFLKAVFWVQNLGADNNEKITVKYGLDGEDSETYTLGALTSSDRIQTLYFNDATVTSGGADINPMTQAVGRSIQLRFSFSTDSHNASELPPRMYAFELHSTLRPPKLKTWEVQVRIGEDLMQESGYYDPVSKTTQLSRLDTLEDQLYPIYFKHTYDGHAGFDEESSTTVQIVDRERLALGDEYEVHRLILQEADTSA